MYKLYTVVKSLYSKNRKKAPKARCSGAFKTRII
ncbi:hypothetical protein EV145_102121 [Flavobacterium sp. 245]|nr:hypothetical protein EV145_102121 [Flavobacterium sp. 245]